MVQINVRVEDDVKKNAEALLNEMGLSMAGAITIFLKTVCREKRIPFEIKADNQSSIDIETRRTLDRVFMGTEDLSLKALIDNTRNLELLYEIQKRLENAVDKGKEFYSDKSEQWANDINKAMLCYCNKRIKQIEEEDGYDGNK